MKEAIIFLQVQGDHKRVRDNGYEFSFDKYQRDSSNLGRVKDEETGQYFFQSFSYPTYYCTDTHHLMLSKKDSKSDFIVLPNKMIEPTRKTQNNSSVFLGPERSLALPKQRTVSQVGLRDKKLEYSPKEDGPKTLEDSPAVKVKPQLMDTKNHDICPRLDRSMGDE